LYSFTGNHKTENLHVILRIKLLYALLSILVSDIWLQAKVTRPSLFPFGLDEQLFPTLWQTSVNNFGRFYSHYICPYPQKRCGRKLWRDSGNFGGSRTAWGALTGNMLN